jgi:hypothetical protein
LRDFADEGEREAAPRALARDRTLRPDAGPLSKSARLAANSELFMVFENVMKTEKAIPSHQCDRSGAISLI